jgi:hypothetical protein
MLEDLVSTRHDHGPILCGPGHCRLATRLTIAEEGERVGARTVEVGFAGSGGGASSWHWYVTLSPSPSVEALPPLPCPGGWRVGAWVGAVLDAPEILSAEPAFREPMVRKFLDIAVDTASNLPLRPAAEPASGSQ